MSAQVQPCVEWQDDLAAYALGGLDDPSAILLEDHLGGCAACRAVLAEYQEVATLLPLALPAAAPPAAARGVLLERAGASGRVPEHKRARRLLPRSGAVRAAFVGLAALLVLAFGLGIWAAARDDGQADTAELVGELQQNDDVRVMTMTGSENAPEAVGQLIVAPDEAQVGLVASGLPILERGHCYQLWWVHTDGTRASGGIFWEDDAGSAITLVDAPEDITDLRWFGVTEEPYPGSEAPTGPSVLGGRP